MSDIRNNKTLRIGHSPDPDDAFMWYPLANFTAPDGRKLTPQIDTRGYDFVHVLEDIQSLNERSLKGELEITAISIHQYPFVADQYALTSCGSSMGDGYGPMIISRKEMELEDIVDESKNITLAIPGKQTTAWLATQIIFTELAGADSVAKINYEVVPFDEIIPRVASGEFDAGLIIHEGQITYQNQNLHLVVDTGKWWQETRHLPLPLGGNCIRRDLAPEMEKICAVLLDSIHCSLNNREDSVNFALNYARDMDSELADEFVGMYVNDWTLDYGEKGRKAVGRLMSDGAKYGIIPDCGEVDFVYPAK